LLILLPALDLDSATPNVEVESGLYNTALVAYITKIMMIL